MKNKEMKSPTWRNSRGLLAAVLVPFLTVAPLGAQITVDGTAFWNSTGSPVTGNFDASGSDKLVVIVTGEHGFPNNEGGNANGVTYDGTPLVQAVDRNPIVVTSDPKVVDQTYNDIWYLDNPDTSTGEIIADVTTRGNVTVFGLSGTAPGVGATVISDRQSRSVDLTTSAPGSLVIASFGMGGDGNTANVNAVTADEPLTQVSAQENGNIWDGHVTGYAEVSAAGTETFSFTDGNVSGAHVIAAEFLSASGAGGSFQLTINPAEAPDSGFDLEWESQAGKLYNLRTSADLAGEISAWTLVEGDIAATRRPTSATSIPPTRGVSTPSRNSTPRRRRRCFPRALRKVMTVSPWPPSRAPTGKLARRIPAGLAAR
jgi:hypothetical protein